MQRLRTEGQLSLSIKPIYEAPNNSIKICFLNARSLHKHIDDIRHDLNYLSTDVNIFSETRFSQLDDDNLYHIKDYTLFRNDDTTRVSQNTRPFGGMAVYSRLDYYPGYPYCANTNGVEITVIRLMIMPHISIVGVYRSPAVPITQLCSAVQHMLDSLPTQVNIFIGDFNVNYFNSSQSASLDNLFVRDNNYRQLVSSFTTDRNTCIDHIYTYLSES